MKYRNGFVANSSSSSFILPIPLDPISSSTKENILAALAPCFLNPHPWEGNSILFDVLRREGRYLPNSCKFDTLDTIEYKKQRLQEQKDLVEQDFTFDDMIVQEYRHQLAYLLEHINETWYFIPIDCNGFENEIEDQVLFDWEEMYPNGPGMNIR